MPDGTFRKALCLNKTVSTTDISMGHTQAVDGNHSNTALRPMIQKLKDFRAGGL